MPAGDNPSTGPQHAARIARGVALTQELRKLASQVHTIADDGTPVTREQMLADLVWKQALGWVEEKRDDRGNQERIVHPPVAWAQQFLWERIEGKAQTANVTENVGIRAADRVRDLAKERLNNLARAVVKGPPAHKPK